MAKRMTLETLVQRLRATYGDGLVCVAVYGSAARGEQVSPHENLNVLVLVDALDMERLAREAPLARQWQKAGHPPPLTLTVEEWRNSADIFPMEYADILAHHRVLYGSLPRELIAVRREDLRVQLEHEVMSKLLRLRHAVLSKGAEPGALIAIMAESVPTMAVLLRAALRCAGEEPPPATGDLMDRVQQRIGLDVEPFRLALQHLRGQRRIAKEEALLSMDRFLAALAALASWLNRGVYFLE
jgi:hypothetical protein